jgi:hypothetical protein
VAAKQNLVAFSFKYRDGHCYIGGFLGTNAALGQWLKPLIHKSVQGIETLTKVTCQYPQTAYAGLAVSLQQEWQYLQRVVPNCRTVFKPVKETITQSSPQPY